MRSSIAIIGMGCRYPGASDVRSFWEAILAKRQGFRRLPMGSTSGEDRQPKLSTVALVDDFDFDWSKRGIAEDDFGSMDIGYWLALETAIEALSDAGYVKEGRWLSDTTDRDRVTVIAGASARTFCNISAHTIASYISQYFCLRGGAYDVDGGDASSLFSLISGARALLLGEADIALVGGVDVHIDSVVRAGDTTFAMPTPFTEVRPDDRAEGFAQGEGAGFVVLKRLSDAERVGEKIYAVLQGWGISSDGPEASAEAGSSGHALALIRACERARCSPLELSFIEGDGLRIHSADRIELGNWAEILASFSQGENHAVERSVGMTTAKSVIGDTGGAAGIAGFIKAVMGVNRRVLPPTACFEGPISTFKGVYPITQGRILPPKRSVRAGVSAAGVGGVHAHVTLESYATPDTRLAPSLPEQSLIGSYQTHELVVVFARSNSAMVDRLAEVRSLAMGIAHAELADLSAFLLKETQREDGSQSKLKAAFVVATVDELQDLLHQTEKRLIQKPLRPDETYISPCQRIWVSYQASEPAQRVRRVGFLFPGQGSQQASMAHTWINRHAWARDLVHQADVWLTEVGCETVSSFFVSASNQVSDEVQLQRWAETLAQPDHAQPAIALCGLLWCEKLRRVGINPSAVVGHSLGEIIAMYASQAIDQKTLIQIAGIRGQCIARGPLGAMAVLRAPRVQVEAILQTVNAHDRCDVFVANVNSATQHVVSGDADAVSRAIELARSTGIFSQPLPMPKPLHSPLMNGVARELTTHAFLQRRFSAPQVFWVSSMMCSGELKGKPIHEFIAKQVIQPIDFTKTLDQTMEHVDWLIEIAPGHVLTGLAKETLPEGTIVLPVASEETKDDDFMKVLAAAFVMGTAVNVDAICEDRLIRKFVPATQRTFLRNHFGTMGAEQELDAPALDVDVAAGEKKQPSSPYRTVVPPAYAPSRPLKAQPILSHPSLPSGQAKKVSSPKSLDVSSMAPERLKSDRVIIDLVSRRTGFPPATLEMEHRVLDDLNLDSIKTAELVGEAAQQIGVAGKIDPMKFGNSRLSDIVQALDAARDTADVEPDVWLSPETNPAHEVQPDVDDSHDAYRKRGTWVRDFCIEWRHQSLSINKVIGTSDTTERRALVLGLEEVTEEVGAAFEKACAEHGVRSATSWQDEPTHVFIFQRAASSEQQPSLHERFNRHVDALNALTREPLSRAHALVFVECDEATPSNHAWCASLHLEEPNLKVLRVRFSDMNHPSQARVLWDEVIALEQSQKAFVSVEYARKNRRYVPVAIPQVADDYTLRAKPIDAGDVVVVTGGGHGITAACALALGKRTGARFVLLGSSPHPHESKPDASSKRNKAIIDTLQAFSDAGVSAEYMQCDVTRADDVERMVEALHQKYGEIAMVLHGAGRNQPRRLLALNEALAQPLQNVLAEIAPKVEGAVNLMRAFGKKPPRLFAGLTSIIGVTGMPGNAWYGFSNEMLDALLAAYSAQSGCEALSVAYGVWDEVGMGAELGTLGRLRAMGIDAIPPVQGAEHFVELILNHPKNRQVIVTARLGDHSLDTWPIESSTVGAVDNATTPFLERDLVLQPSVEYLGRTTLTTDKDPYLLDHDFRGSLLFPTVFGLEAMAQAVYKIRGGQITFPITVENVQLRRPIAVPANGLEIEIHAVASALRADAVDVGIYTQIDGFMQPHFSARFVCGVAKTDTLEAWQGPGIEHKTTVLSPESELYGWLLFQGKRFQRMQDIIALDSRRCVFNAQPSSGANEGGQARDLNHMLLGDAFVRDALLQSVQPSVPQDISLPIEISTWTIAKPLQGAVVGEAVIEQRIGDVYHTHVYAADTEGKASEAIEGYQLKVMEHHTTSPTVQQLLQPHDRLNTLAHDDFAKAKSHYGVLLPEFRIEFAPELVSLGRDKKREQIKKFFDALLAKSFEGNTGDDVEWLESGKPIVKDVPEIGVSVAHEGAFCLVAAGVNPVGVDITPVASRDRQTWHTMLPHGTHSLLDALSDEALSFAEAAASVWAAREAVFKACGTYDIELQIKNRQAKTVLFEAHIVPSSTIEVVSVILEPVRGLARAVALTVTQAS